MADLNCEEGAGDEIVEFEHVADGRGNRGAHDVPLFEIDDSLRQSMLPSMNDQLPIEYFWPGGVQWSMKTALAYLVIAIAVVVALWTIIHGFPFI